MDGPHDEPDGDKDEDGPEQVDGGVGQAFGGHGGVTIANEPERTRAVVRVPVRRIAGSAAAPVSRAICDPSPPADRARSGATCHQQQGKRRPGSGQESNDPINPTQRTA
jgi:hypothetical protein